MKKEKVLEVVIDIKSVLEENFPAVQPKRHTGEIDDEIEKVEHLKFLSSELIGKIKSDFENKQGKIFRHLGFLQGVMWALGLQTVDDLKKVNMPDNEKFRNDV